MRITKDIQGKINAEAKDEEMTGRTLKMFKNTELIMKCKRDDLDVQKNDITTMKGLDVRLVDRKRMNQHGKAMNVWSGLTLQLADIKHGNHHHSTAAFLWGQGVK